MNYKKIYDDFITDRLLKQDFEGYGEKHHIIPRSMGGSDDKSNIIRLTAEDHFYAHLFLAKAYGGTQWNSVAIMMERKHRNGRTWKIQASSYALARRMTSIGIRESGLRADENNNNYKSELIELHNTDGTRIIDTRLNIVNTTKLNHAHISMLLSTEHKTKSIFGYYNPTNTSIKDLEHTPGIHKEKLHFTNTNGEIFIGTPVQLIEHVFGYRQGIGAADCYAMVTGKINLFRGWYITKNGYEGWGKNGRTYFEDPKLYTLTHTSGKKVTLTQKEAGKQLGRGIIAQIRRNVSNISKGWKIDSVS